MAFSEIPPISFSAEGKPLNINGINLETGMRYFFTTPEVSSVHRSRLSMQALHEAASVQVYDVAHGSQDEAIQFTFKQVDLVKEVLNRS